ncbi:MAG: hypothetical protein IMF13_00535 [Proteobacteria bacterium]|nr:hypothetical protein [Pseudomonadota bacterium]
MEIPIEALKGGLWWIDEALANADLTHNEYLKTKKHSEELTKYIKEVEPKE